MPHISDLCTLSAQRTVHIRSKSGCEDSRAVFTALAVRRQEGLDERRRGAFDRTCDVSGSLVLVGLPLKDPYVNTHITCYSEVISNHQRNGN